MIWWSVAAVVLGFLMAYHRIRAAGAPEEDSDLGQMSAGWMESGRWDALKERDQR